jgi:hypothetical protein
MLTTDYSPVMMNTVWCLQDTGPQNGGTRIVPGPPGARVGLHRTTVHGCGVTIYRYSRMPAPPTLPATRPVQGARTHVWSEPERVPAPVHQAATALCWPSCPKATRRPSSSSLCAPPAPYSSTTASAGTAAVRQPRPRHTSGCCCCSPCYPPAPFPALPLAAASQGSAAAASGPPPLSPGLSATAVVLLKGRAGRRAPGGRGGAGAALALRALPQELLHVPARPARRLPARMVGPRPGPREVVMSMLSSTLTHSDSPVHNTVVPDRAVLSLIGCHAPSTANRFAVCCIEQSGARRNGRPARIQVARALRPPEGPHAHGRRSGCGPVNARCTAPGVIENLMQYQFQFCCITPDSIG